MKTLTYVLSLFAAMLLMAAFVLAQIPHEAALQAVNGFLLGGFSLFGLGILLARRG